MTATSGMPAMRALGSGSPGSSSQNDVVVMSAMLLRWHHHPVCPLDLGHEPRQLELAERDRDAGRLEAGGANELVRRRRPAPKLVEHRGRGGGDDRRIRLWRLHAERFQHVAGARE